MNIYFRIRLHNIIIVCSQLKKKNQKKENSYPYVSITIHPFVRTFFSPQNNSRSNGKKILYDSLNYGFIAGKNIFELTSFSPSLSNSNNSYTSETHEFSNTYATKHGTFWTAFIFGVLTRLYSGLNELLMTPWWM